MVPNDWIRSTPPGEHNFLSLCVMRQTSVCAPRYIHLFSVREVHSKKVSAQRELVPDTPRYAQNVRVLHTTTCLLFTCESTHSFDSSSSVWGGIAALRCSIIDRMMHERSFALLPMHRRQRKAVSRFIWTKCPGFFLPRHPPCW